MLHWEGFAMKSEKLEKLRAINIVALGLGIVSGAAIATPSYAQQEQADSIEEITIIGSRIRRVEEEGPSPVVTITAVDFEERGYATVTDALNDLSQNAGGGFDQQNTFGFTPSASAIDLRGFGAGRTLVLVDGRRLPVFPIASGGVDNFVDLSSIPIGAIERVEVLTDGASAIYGSDALSGVVNIVLKKNADTQLTARQSDTTEGGGGQTRIQFSTGLEGADGGNALFFLEYFKQRELKFTDREYSRSDRLGGITGAGPGIFSSFGDPGTYLTFNPMTGAQLGTVPAANCNTSGGGPGNQGGFCRFNRAQFRQLVPTWDQFSLTGKYERPVGSNATFFGRATYFRSETDTEIEPMAYDQSTDGPGFFVGTGSLSNPTNPAADPGNQYADTNLPGIWRRRLVEFGPRLENTQNNTYSVTTGVRGELASRYSWEAGVAYTEQRITSRNSGYAKKDAFSRLVHGDDLNGDGIGDGGTLNLFNPIPQNIVDQVKVEPRSDGFSSVAGVDFQLTGPLADVFGRTVQFAVVAEYNKQRFSDERSPDVLAGNVIALGGSAGGGDRKYQALGLELEMPVFEPLTVNIAGRYDNYDDDSDVGGAFSPRIAIKYTPFRSLALRASVGKSFRAPDLQRLFGAETTAFQDLIDTPECVRRGGTGRGDARVSACVDQAQSIETRTGANRRLEEEEGENYNFGIIWEPLDGASVSADFFYIALEQIVNTPDVQFILDRNALDGSFADAITRLPGSVSPQNPGGLDIVRATARNLSFQRLSGVDVSGEFRLRTDDLGTFTAALNATYLQDLKSRELPGEEIVNVLANGELGEYVRFRGAAELGWKRGVFGANVLVSHIGAFTPLDPTSFPEVGSWTTVNVNGTWETPLNSTLAIGVNNVFDRDPPFDLQAGNSSQPFYNQFFHDAFGATWHVTYTQKF
jgi:iron complex outermembrane receptor protein